MASVDTLFPGLFSRTLCRDDFILGLMPDRDQP